MDDQLPFELVKRAKLTLRGARKKLGRELGGKLTVRELFARFVGVGDPKLTALVAHFIPAPAGRRTP